MADQKLLTKIRRNVKLGVGRRFIKGKVDLEDNKKEKQRQSLLRKLRGRMKGRTKFV